HVTVVVSGRVILGAKADAVHIALACPCDRDACQRRSGAIFADDPDPRDILTTCDKDVACDRGGEVIAADHLDTLGPTRVSRPHYRDVAVDLERHTPTAEIGRAHV